MNRRELARREVPKTPAKGQPEEARTSNVHETPLSRIIGDAPRVNIIGEDINELGNAVVESVFPTIEEIVQDTKNFPVFFLETTPGIADPLKKKVYDAGLTVIHYRVSSRLLDMLNDKQASRVVATSMPTEGRDRPSRRVETQLLQDVYECLAVPTTAQPDKAQDNDVVTGEIVSSQNAEVPEVEAYVPSRLEVVHDALTNLLDPAHTGYLDDRQKDRLERKFGSSGDAMRQTMIDVRAHVNTIVERPDEDPEFLTKNVRAPKGLMVFDVAPDINPVDDSVVADFGLLILETAVREKTPIGQPRKIVTAFKRKSGPSSDLLERFDDSCGKKKVGSVFVHLGITKESFGLVKPGDPLVVTRTVSHDALHMIEEEAGVHPDKILKPTSKTVSPHNYNEPVREQSTNLSIEERLVLPARHVAALGRGKMYVVMRDETGRANVTHLGAEPEGMLNLPTATGDATIVFSREPQLFVDKVAQGLSNLRAITKEKVANWKQRHDKVEENVEVLDEHTEISQFPED